MLYLRQLHAILSAASGSLWEILAARLGTIHNLFYYLSLMKGLRTAIEQQRLAEFTREFYALRGGRPQAASVSNDNGADAGSAED